MHEPGTTRLDGWRTECWCGETFAGELIWHCLLCGHHPPDEQLCCSSCGATRAVVSAGGRALPAFVLVQSGERLLRYKPVAELTGAEVDVREFRQLADAYVVAAWETTMAELQVMANPDDA
ncbi:MAG: hypothetical protein GEV08_07855 [Acidimicrobiia bacterium]|nr:hypothetical protein [Acidimicrobiia bacterium]